MKRKSSGFHRVTTVGVALRLLLLSAPFLSSVHAQERDPNAALSDELHRMQRRPVEVDLSRERPIAPEPDSRGAAEIQREREAREPFLRQAEEAARQAIQAAEVERRLDVARSIAPFDLDFGSNGGAA